MKKKENQRIALTKRLLKESLLRLMEKKNIRNITVSELCEEAQINRSTFYNHYGCPADVLKEMEIGMVRDLDEISRRSCSGTEWPMNKRVEALCTYLQENRRMAKLLFRDSGIDSEFAMMLFRAQHVQSAYEEILARAGGEDSKRLIVTFLSTGAYQMIRLWLLEDIPMTPKEIGDLVILLARQGSAGVPEHR